MDNVAVATQSIPAGETVSVEHITLTAKSEIPFGHKIALFDIKMGENVIKYGYPIGHAVEDISSGDHVHTHNIKTNLTGTLQYTY
jgi:altronate hydrolase